MVDHGRSDDSLTPAQRLGQWQESTPQACCGLLGLCPGANSWRSQKTIPQFQFAFYCFLLFFSPMALGETFITSDAGEIWPSLPLWNSAGAPCSPLCSPRARSSFLKSFTSLPSPGLGCVLVLFYVEHHCPSSNSLGLLQMPMLPSALGSHTARSWEAP